MIKIDPSSFRDPSGYVFYKDNQVFRNVHHVYRKNYDSLISTGLYQELVEHKLLIRSDECSETVELGLNSYKVLKVDRVPFISYPYEWCFSQLKDAALLLIQIQKISLKHEMILKDASAFNVQFIAAKPIWIDTLSFEIYQPDQPWVAYRQFCQHFLSPLALMAYQDTRCSIFSRFFIDGIPLGMASKLLPLRSYFNFGLLLHLHLHSRAGTKKSQIDFKVQSNKRRLSKTGLLGILDQLESTIKGFVLPGENTVWKDYYDNTNYSEQGVISKKNIVADFLSKIPAGMAWDLGSNTGMFSKITADAGFNCVAMDGDRGAVEKCYSDNKKHFNENILPIWMDISNPSPSLGWGHTERLALAQRGPADVVLALALIHHLVLAQNTPFDKVGQFLSLISRYIIIEFVPKDDMQSQRLLATRQDIFIDYNVQRFELVFKKYFTIIDKKSVTDSKRVIYLMKRVNNS